MAKLHIRHWKGQLKQLYANLKIKQKLLLYSMGLLAVLCSIFALFYGKLASDIVIDRSDTTTAANIDSIELFFDDVAQDINNRLHHLNSSISVRNALLVANDHGDSSQWPVDALLYDITNSDYISALSLYALDGTLVAGAGNEAFFDLDPTAEGFSAITSEEFTAYWCDESLYFHSRTEGLSLYLPIKGVSGSPIGVARVDVSAAALSELYSYVGFNISSQLYLFSNQGNLILPIDADPTYLIIGRNNFLEFEDGVNQAVENTTYQNAQYRVYNQPMPNFGLYVVGIVPHAQLMEDIYSQQVLIGGLGVICILLQILTLLFLAHSLSAPLQELSAHMEQVSAGDLSLRMNNQNGDEIGQLSRSYDHMLSRIEDLLQEVSDAERQRHALELTSLQTQITPHFLYNSLENLSALAQMGEMDSAFQMAKSLGLFYRGVLSDGHSVVRMDEEVAIIHNYLKVQAQRYPDSFDYTITLDPTLAHMSILKLTLQPLVENAINHGLRNVRRRGLLTITIQPQGDLIYLCVKDNGKGMEQIPDLSSTYVQSEDFTLRRGGYGMGNVDQRLKLYYGGRYGLSISSMPGVGTDIYIRIPQIPYQEDGYDIRFNRG